MRTRRGIATIVGVLLVLVGWYVLLWSPSSKQLSTARAAHEAALQQQQTIQAQKAALEAKIRALPSDVKKAQYYLQEIPPTADVPGFIDQITGAAQATGTTLNSLSQSVNAVATQGSSTAGSTSTPSGLGTMSVAMSVSGSYAQMMRFIEVLQRLPRFVSVATAGFSGTSGALVTSMTATTYFDPALLPKVPVIHVPGA